jgi:soluble lytic murein transglycosylase-like protein
VFTVSTSYRSRKRENILRNFCFKLVFTILTAGVVFGAGTDRPLRITSVVRSDPRTGKLVRSMVVSPKAVAEKRIAETVVPAHVVGADAAAPQEPSEHATGIDAAVERIAAEHSLPPQLIHSVIKVESNYNPNAVSSKGALGLMQLIPSTARRFGVSDAFNPVQNIQGGAKYLRYLLDLFDGSYPLALAAYNAGEAAVARYGGIPPYAETQNYVILVRKQLEKAAAAAKAAVAPAPVIEAKQTGPAHIVEEVQPDGSVRYVSR